MFQQLQESVTTDGNLCEHDYNLIKNWKYNANSSHISCDLTKPQVNQFLTHFKIIFQTYIYQSQGWNDLKHLAMSYQTMFPTLFDPIYTPQAYTFGHSSAQRTRSSCAAFSEGLFGSGMMQWYSAIHFFTDNLLLRVCIPYHIHYYNKNCFQIIVNYSHGWNVKSLIQ